MMNKQIAAVLGLALMLTACGNNDNTAPDMSVTESETITEISAESETASETASVLIICRGFPCRQTVPLTRCKSC